MTFLTVLFNTRSVSPRGARASSLPPFPLGLWVMPRVTTWHYSTRLTEKRLGGRGGRAIAFDRRSLRTFDWQVSKIKSLLFASKYSYIPTVVVRVRSAGLWLGFNPLHCQLHLCLLSLSNANWKRFYLLRLLSILIFRFCTLLGALVVFLALTSPYSGLFNVM